MSVSVSAATTCPRTKGSAVLAMSSRKAWPVMTAPVVRMPAAVPSLNHVVAGWVASGCISICA